LGTFYKDLGFPWNFKIYFVKEKLWTWSTSRAPVEGAVHGGPTTMAGRRGPRSPAYDRSGRREADLIARGGRGEYADAHQ
jgi:hypothetical protein